MRVLCLWWCSWRCIYACWPLCRAFPLEKLDTSDDEIYAFAERLEVFADRPDVLAQLVAASTVRTRSIWRHRQGAQARTLLRPALPLAVLRLVPRFCICVCPPLIGKIDKPDGTCAEAIAVQACIRRWGPLIAIEITGTAGGGGFDHYTLRYS